MKGMLLVTIYALLHCVSGADVVLRSDEASIIMGSTGDVRLGRSGPYSLATNASVMFAGNVSLSDNGSLFDLLQEIRTTRATLQLVQTQLMDLVQ